MEIALGVIIPFIGTVLGSLLVFFMKDKIGSRVEKGLLGFAGGVMVAASVFSLIVPSINMSKDMGKWAFAPCAIGFIVGIAFLFLLDIIVPHIHASGAEEGKGQRSLKKTTKMLLAVTLHNIPEGMAVGVVMAGWLADKASISFAGALALSIGIAIQNFPEGAVVAMPLRTEGMSKGKAFLCGSLSGIVEPIASLLTILLVSVVQPILPYILGFAAGAMFYVIVEELIPDSQTGGHTNTATICFALGFVLMMALDVALG